MKVKPLQNIQDMNSKIKAAFDMVKSEMEDHRESINENTNELQSVYEYMYEIDAKLQKMNERLDEVQLTVSGKAKPHEEVQRLTLREKEVALVLYMENSALSADLIAKRTGLTEDLVKGYLKSMLSKGVPIKDSEGNYFFNAHFKNLQATANILQLNEAISQDLQY